MDRWCSIWRLSPPRSCSPLSPGSSIGSPEQRICKPAPIVRARRRSGGDRGKRDTDRHIRWIGRRVWCLFRRLFDIVIVSSTFGHGDGVGGTSDLDKGIPIQGRIARDRGQRRCSCGCIIGICHPVESGARLVCRGKERSRPIEIRGRACTGRGIAHSQIAS
jgi:hypothetical protein